MKNITKEYIEFFGYYEQIEKVLNDFFALVSQSLSAEDNEYFTRLRSSFDMSGLMEKISVSLEDTFSESELEQIINLHRKNPVLMKVLHTRDSITALQQDAGRKMVEEALKRMPFLVKGGNC
jgi:hypothetical protein